ncbi:UNVERIFIED_CONTAM: helix-turn-helix domain-containing protein, partial [Salmonella enterica subsp. enterica serovar Weltevreden]
GRVQHELACERLATSTLSITEIAYSLGFRDTANFTRAFRSRAGCSPRDYRDRSRSQSAAVAGASRSNTAAVPLS